jgi:hypothetical protein
MTGQGKLNLNGIVFLNVTCIHGVQNGIELWILMYVDVNFSSFTSRALLKALK